MTRAVVDDDRDEDLMMWGHLSPEPEVMCRFVVLRHDCVVVRHCSFVSVTQP